MAETQNESDAILKEPKIENNEESEKETEDKIEIKIIKEEQETSVTDELHQETEVLKLTVVRITIP